MGEICREKEIADPHARAKEQGGCHGPASSRRNLTRRFVDAFAEESRRERRVALRHPSPTRGADAPPCFSHACGERRPRRSSLSARLKVSSRLTAMAPMTRLFFLFLPRLFLIPTLASFFGESCAARLSRQGPASGRSSVLQRLHR